MIWKPIVILKKIKKGDYYYALVEYHPNATKNNYVLYHRVVMENSLKRYLLPDEEVHHIDKRTKNNKIGNLQVLSSVEHRALHSKERGQLTIILRCPSCRKIFEREKRRTHLIQGGFSTSCSRKCGGLTTRALQKDLSIIKDNVIKEFRKFV